MQIILPKFTMGVGDRFAREGNAQLAALIQARKEGIEVSPVWNKSFREHSIIHTQPPSVREAADKAVQDMKWSLPYFVDADHINLKTVDGFIASSDFFTLDVASVIGTPADPAAVKAFVAKYSSFCGDLPVEGLASPLVITRELLESVARKYLFAVQEAGRIYRHIERQKGVGCFVTEVSMDETMTPQTPHELLVILAAIAGEGIPAQTIAPRFTGRFNKGVDYVGDVAQFAREFEADVAVIRFACCRFQLPSNLKLSVHSGSDKFKIYGPIRTVLQKTGAGLHLKTAGTTWLEEVIGLAEAGGDGLAIAKDVYTAALGRFDELCGPYAEVINIDRKALPSTQQVATWDSKTFVSALRHDQTVPGYNPNLRQLLHVGYKVAAEMGARYLDALETHRGSVARNVETNLYERHIKPLFPPGASVPLPVTNNK
ncbi:MAG: tagaturonate epimerase family protein [bacterium]